MDGRASSSGIIAIPHTKRFPYGDDLAATRSAGRARASVRDRVGHLIERSSGYRAARVSRCKGIHTSSGTAIAVTRAGDCPASQGRTRAATPMKPLGIMSQRVSCRSQLDSNPEVSGKAGAVQCELLSDPLPHPLGKVSSRNASGRLLQVNGGTNAALISFTTTDAPCRHSLKLSSARRSLRL